MLFFQKVITVISVVLVITTALPAQAQIIMVNSPPELSLSSESLFGDNGVYPNEGEVGTDFTFRVRYRDEDGDEPEYIKACLFLPGKNMGCHNLTVATNDQDPQEAYEVEAQGAVQLTEPGAYSYYFKTYDDNGMWGPFPVRWPEQGEEFSLSVIDSGNTSVAFIPGLQASRLYKENILGEDKLWEPTNRNEDVRDLMMNEAGLSIDPNIYTRDIIDETYGLNIYKGFIEFMDGLVNESTISDWEALPYDWRLAPKEVVERGVMQDNGKISYFSPLPAGTQPYMVKKLEELAESSANGKVTIIAHSNGGLVAKALLIYLAEEKVAGRSDLIDKIDQLIMVAVPQVGTPKALAGLLHGDEQSLVGGLLLTKSLARELAENMPGAYSLLPSRKYFEAVADPVIQFTDEVKKIYDFRSIYGESVDTWEEMRKFLKGDDGKRSEPEANDINQPNVLNDVILTDAGDLSGKLDTWQAPAGLEVIQIAGWGLSTIYGIEYDKCGLCFFGQDLSDLDRKAKQTVDGDGTVVTGSAVGVSSQDYFVNMLEYNKAWLVNRDHKNILEVESLRDFIREIITGEQDSLPDFMSAEKPSYVLGDTRHRLRMKSPVTVDAYDSGGIHTGLKDNPNPNSDLRLYEEQIPNSSYFEFGEQKYLNLDGEDEYEIKLEGEGTGVFTLEIEEVKGDEVVKTMLFKNIPVTDDTVGSLRLTTSGENPQLTLDLDGDGNIDDTVQVNEPLSIEAAINLLRQEIKDLETRRFNKRFLLRRLRLAERFINRDRLRVAKYMLQAMDRYIERGVDKRWGIVKEDAVPLREIIASIRESL